MYRQHLGYELASLPDVRYQNIQSYALTTGVLVRKIIQHFKINSIRIADFYDQGKYHQLEKVLGALIHYARFEPHYRNKNYMSQNNNNDKDNIVRLKSDTKELSISLNDYFDILSRFAHDDLFITHHFFSSLVTLLTECVKYPLGKVSSGEYQNFICDFADDAFGVVSKLVESGTIQIPQNLEIFCYQDAILDPNDPFNSQQLEPAHMSCASFIRGFNDLGHRFLIGHGTENFYGITEYVYRRHWKSEEFHTLVIPFEDLLNMSRVIKAKAREGAVSP
ncbi:MAG: hypothetical protein F4032_04395 [Gemmatimonadetes bacterium]|nr:hypothetical protein [Gemmatimonadota bacterium]MYK50992.1 hypothetical protein [Gemmatimonadota bacterium]